MTEVVIDKRTGMVSPPVYSCYRGKGLCRIRRTNDGHFECSEEFENCRYRVIEESGSKKK